jgi:hypothetical protein
MFITGQKIVCIDDVFAPEVAQFYISLPKRDVVYVVRGLAPAFALDGKTEEIAVYLIGIQNPCSNVAPFRERGFRCERFRPLDEMTDEEIMGSREPVLVPVTRTGEANAGVA